MKQFVILLALFAAHFSFAQSDYGDYPAARRTEVFFDDFEDNQNEWMTGSFSKGNRVAQVENGYYSWNANSKYYGLNASWKSIPINEIKDFEIEAAIKLVKEKRRSEAAALSWGRSGKGSFYLAFKDDEFVVSIWTDRRKPELVTEWTPTPFLQENEYNKLTVRKVGSTYYLFINEELVHTMAKTKRFFGSDIGFESNNLIHVDYLRVSYLKDKNSESVPVATPVAQTPSGRETQPTVAAGDTLAESATVASLKPKKTDPARALPTITIVEPEISRGFKKTPSQRLRVSGKADSPDGVQNRPGQRPNCAAREQRSVHYRDSVARRYQHGDRSGEGYSRAGSDQDFFGAARRRRGHRQATGPGDRQRQLPQRRQPAKPPQRRTGNGQYAGGVGLHGAQVRRL